MKDVVVLKFRLDLEYIEKKNVVKVFLVFILKNKLGFFIFFFNLFV